MTWRSWRRTSGWLARRCGLPGDGSWPGATPRRRFESGTTLRTTLIEFPSVDDAVAAYHSAAYQEALRTLADGAEREIRIIEAVE